MDSRSRNDSMGPARLRQRPPRRGARPQTRLAGVSRHFQRHWPTDEDIYVDFVRDGIRGNGAARVGNSRWRRLTEERAGGAKSREATATLRIRAKRNSRCFGMLIDIDLSELRQRLVSLLLFGEGGIK